MASNPYINRVDYVINGTPQTLINLTGDTVTPSTLKQGETAHDASGAPIVGTMVAGITPSGNINITQAGQTDVTNYATATVASADPYISAAAEYTTYNNTRFWMLTPFVEVDEGEGDTAGYIANGSHMNGQTIEFDAVPANTTITPSTSAQTVGGTDYMMEGAITVNPIPSQYIIPSGNKSITANGTGIDVSQYATVSVAVPATSPSLQSKDVTPSNVLQTVTPDTGYDGLSQVRVFGIPNGLSGTQSVSRSLTTTDHVTTITWPNVTAGYFSSMPTGTSSLIRETKSVTPNTTTQTISCSGVNYYLDSVTVYPIPSQYIVPSGTYTVTGSGTADVTNYASVSVPALTLPTEPSSSSSGTKKADIYWSDSGDRYLNIPSGFNNTAQHYRIYGLTRGEQTFTANGEYYASSYDLDGFSKVTVNVSGGGSSGVKYEQIEGYASSSTSITFTGLKGSPLAFFVMSDEPITPGATPVVSCLSGDGSDIHADLITNTSNSQVTYDGSSFAFSYNNGSLTIASSGSATFNGIYFITYAYDGSAACVGTKDVQVGSGATSITFTGLEDEPLCWWLNFKSNFSTSSGYQRVIGVRKNDNNIAGSCMDSSAKIGLYWTASYSNGSLTVASNGTNQGGYFHQPGYYELVYIIDVSGNMQSKTVTPTTSQQVVTADSGYDGLSRVTVNAIPSTYVQPTSTIGATTYRASTSNQTIASGTYHSAAATIAAVTQTNLTAANIKSGTTITISNGQSNLWSVTGTYTGGGGGGSATVASATTTASNYPTSISFTNLAGEPIAWFLRSTSQISSSGNTTYYYIIDARYNGTNVTGNCFRIGGTRQVNNITSGYSQSYSNGTLTITSSASSRSASPGAFNNSYELVYVY